MPAFSASTAGVAMRPAALPGLRISETRETREVRLTLRWVPSLAPSEQWAKAIPPSTLGPTEVSLCAPRSLQGGKLSR